MDEIRNRVAESGLITLNLEDFFHGNQNLVFDLKDFLFMELILKEKEFRSMLDEHDWSKYQDKRVYITCSVDAIIPMWAYMLVVSKLVSIAKDIQVGSPEEVEKKIIIHQIQGLDEKKYVDKRVVVKGCGDKRIAECAYVEITKKLIPVVKSLMFGEPCSTVPVYKKKD
jgi:hypothetical protein